MESQREQTLHTLHTAAAEIQASESVEAACQRTVEAAAEVLDLKMCTVLHHDDGWLVPVALSEGARPDGARQMRPDQGLAGKTFQTGESYVVDEIEPDDDSDPAKASYESGISVPIGDTGVFQAVADEPAAFDETDVEFAELLVAHTARTIDRIQFERELREQRAALRRQKERLEEVIAGVSHDLRNPLNVAKGRLELAREACDSEQLDTVAQQHERMQTLIEDLLTLAEQGRPVEDREPVTLASVSERSWDHVETDDHTLVVDTELTVTGNANRLQQLFENLFRNAVDYGGDDVTVTVGTLSDETGFYVADDGPGIPAEHRGDVFDRGYSLSDSGTGFGLAIVREVASAHDWSVRASESADGGARFEFTGVERTTETTPVS
jgi:signal transduction histidine kinase